VLALSSNAAPANYQFTTSQWHGRRFVGSLLIARVNVCCRRFRSAQALLLIDRAPGRFKTTRLPAALRQHERSRDCARRDRFAAIRWYHSPSRVSFPPLFRGQRISPSSISLAGEDASIFPKDWIRWSPSWRPAKQASLRYAIPLYFRIVWHRRALVRGLM